MDTPMNFSTAGCPTIAVLPPLSAPGEVQAICHRIINHLHMLSAMALADASEGIDAVARATLDVTRLRISAISSVYRQLGGSPAPQMVDLGAYLQDLATDMEQGCAYTVGKHRILVKTTTVMVTPERATAIGVMVCELVAGACRDAYVPGERGDVKVSLMKTFFGGYRLEVEDRARGKSSNVRARRANRQLIEGMAVRLGGLYCWQDAAPGTRYVLYLEAKV